MGLAGIESAGVERVSCLHLVAVWGLCEEETLLTLPLLPQEAVATQWSPF